jgi:hypothetical protein
MHGYGCEGNPQEVLIVDQTVTQSQPVSRLLGVASDGVNLRGNIW